MAPQLKAIVDTNQYVIQRKIAEGGMGTVYEAIQQGANGFGKTVAIKTIVPRFSANEEIVEMFIHEAKLVANLVHENIVQIYQLGRTEDDGWYIVMEYVNGLSLYDFIRFHRATHQTIPVDLAVFIASRIARGLAYAHTRVDANGTPLHIVHRDICPNNILITAEGLAKLTDFGIAKAANRARASFSRGLMGKLAYMSPEQARRDETDFRADHFALGAVLFEMLSLDYIRDAEDEASLRELARTGKVEWSRLPTSCPKPLRKLLHQALNPDYDKRFESTADFARNLEYFIYKDGYGPTVQALEDYLHQQFPYIYKLQRPSSQGIPATQIPATVRLAPSATLIMQE